MFVDDLGDPKVAPSALEVLGSMPCRMLSQDSVTHPRLRDRCLPLSVSPSIQVPEGVARTFERSFVTLPTKNRHNVTIA